MSTSTGISGCYQPHRQTAMPGQKSIYETFLVVFSSTVCTIHCTQCTVLHRGMLLVRRLLPPVHCSWRQRKAQVKQKLRAGTFKRVWGPGIDAKASIPPAYVAWRAGTIIRLTTDRSCRVGTSGRGCNCVCVTVYSTLTGDST
jgi:hypothetical protein